MSESFFDSLNEEIKDNAGLVFAVFGLEVLRSQKAILKQLRAESDKVKDGLDEIEAIKYEGFDFGASPLAQLRIIEKWIDDASEVSACVVGHECGWDENFWKETVKETKANLEDPQDLKLADEVTKKSESLAERLAPVCERARQLERSLGKRMEEFLGKSGDVFDFYFNQAGTNKRVKIKDLSNAFEEELRELSQEDMEIADALLMFHSIGKTVIGPDRFSFDKETGKIFLNPELSKVAACVRSANDFGYLCDFFEIDVSIDGPEPVLQMETTPRFRVLLDFDLYGTQFRNEVKRLEKGVSPAEISREPLKYFANYNED